MRLTDDMARDVRSAGSPSGHFAVPKPLYSQVRDMLAGRISAGHWSQGDTLPNEASLAQSFAVSIGTIRRAVEGLEDMGLVIRRQGRGKFIAGTEPFGNADKHCRLRSVNGDRIELTYQAPRVVRRTCRPAEAAALGLGNDGEVVEVHQTVVTKDGLVGIERSVLPASLTSNLEENFAQAASLYAALRDKGIIVTRAEETVTACAADDEDAAALGIPNGQPLLVIERQAYSFDHRTIELRTGRYLPRAVSFVTASA